MADYYPPRKLPRNREYPGYQFYCTLRKPDGSAEDCFCRAAMSVIDWLRQRLRETDVIPPMIAGLPAKDQASGLRPADLVSFTISSGFSARAVSLPAHGIWTLRLKEPDSGTDQREAVSGRFFTTNVGLHILGRDRVELGIRIDVTEPEGVPEVDFAFRPQFVRDLYAAPDLIPEQAAELPYQKAIPVENEAQLKRLRTVLDSTAATLPVILVTQALRLPAGVSARVEDIPLSALEPVSGSGPDLPRCPLLEPYYPVDADQIAAHNFGHAVTCRVSEEMRERLAYRLKKNYTPGDLLFVDPKRYGGHTRVFGCKEKDVAYLVWQRAHSYSKNRRYSFGDVRFEYEARSTENRETIDRIRASGETVTKEQIAGLNRKIDELQEENEEQVRKIDDLKEQLLSEFSRGQEAERQQTEWLLNDHELLEEELRRANAHAMTLEQENREARAIRSAVEAFRTMPELPRTNADVVAFFRRVFGDRIVFTEQGLGSASRCAVRPDGLWYYLYHMATTLFDLHHAGCPDTETEFFRATGIEAARGEGSQSRKDRSVMQQRIDTYEGKQISLEPHVKLAQKKAGADHQRIYYCYDREFDRIIIGWIGEHLKTAGTVHLS